MSGRRPLGGGGPEGPERIGGAAPETTRLPQAQAAGPATPVVLQQAGRVEGSDSNAQEPWWQTAFGQHYETVYTHRSDTAAAEEVAGLLPRLREAGGLVCDACCGNGRHLAAMRAAGLQVLGFDFSATLLSKAVQRPGARGRFFRADVRHPALHAGAFDAVTLLFTAFGYFDEASNAAALAALLQLLRPEGRLVIDLPDPDHLRATLVASSERQQVDGSIIRERRQLTTTQVIKDVEVERDGQRVAAWQEQVRLYTTAEIAGLARDAGAELEETWSSLRGMNSEDHRQVHWLRRLNRRAGE